MLGGPDRTTLFVCTADASDPAETEPMRGAIEVCEVDGAGRRPALTQSVKKPGWVPSTISSSRRCVALACASSERTKNRLVRTASTTRAA